MPTGTRAKQDKLPVINWSSFEMSSNTQELHLGDRILKLLSSVIKGGGYVTLGTNRARTAILMTVNEADGAKTFVGGSDLESFLEDFDQLLTENGL